MTVLQLGEFFDELAACSGANRKTALLTTLFSRLASSEARVVAKILLSEFRIGLQEGLVYAEHILPFAVLQKRIGRRQLSENLLRDAPVAFFAFDLLLLDQEVLLDDPLMTRIRRLRDLLSSSESAIRQGHQAEVRDAIHLDELFDAARARANEGLVVKDPSSRYTPGRRGKSWLKYKKALATLDCVVTAAEHGHGKRRGVLSDYTFAIRRDQDLLNTGKAYSGLTDAEIEQVFVGRIAEQNHA